MCESPPALQLADTEAEARFLIVLHPEYPKYKPMVLQGDAKNGVRIIGKVLWFKRMMAWPKNDAL